MVGKERKKPSANLVSEFTSFSRKRHRERKKIFLSHPHTHDGFLYSLNLHVSVEGKVEKDFEREKRMLFMVDVPLRANSHIIQKLSPDIVSVRMKFDYTKRRGGRPIPR